MEHPSLFLARAVLALAGLLAVIPPAAADEALGLSAAVSAAVARSRSLDASTTAAQGAREVAVAAAQRPDPVLRLSLDNLPVDGPDRFSTTRDFMTMRSIGLTQTLPNAEKRRARGVRFEREAEAALSERAQRVAQLQTEVAQAWLERRMQEQRWLLLQAQITEARVLVQTLDAALRGGRGSVADVFSAREALAQLEQGLIGAQAERTNARLTLARFTGGPPDQPLAEPPPYRQIPAVIDPLNHLPDLAALQAREAVARAEAEVARQELQPDWSAEIVFSQRGSQFSNMVSVGVSVPLQWDKPQRQQRELAARLARVNELEAEREERTRERVLQVQRWQQDWRAGQDRLAYLDAHRQPLATQRVDVALAAYRGGREGLGAVLQARRDALNLALERLTLERDTAGLWAQLEYLNPDRSTGVKP
uniref:Putative outer membrane cation efflux protein n=1 Tax=Hydrogenophaga sp. PL2G6 TaxID=503997 RepID=B4Y334_9BURK|nr:putative outer membrane cation efflux protein [Hydrogenophaga sp. PL2G6]